MRIAIITDIHEDIASLEKMVGAITKYGHDILVCLGDITGYSPVFYSHQPDANACIDLLRQQADIVIAGNHDLYTIGRLPSYHEEKKLPQNWYSLSIAERIRMSKNRVWLYQDEIIPELSNENRDFLTGLKEWETLETNHRKYLFTHFFRPDMAGILRWFPFNSMEIGDHFRFMKKNACDLAFVGHSHPSGPVTINRLFWSHPNDETVKIRKHHKAIICPAVVGERYPGGCVVFDSEKMELTTLTI